MTIDDPALPAVRHLTGPGARAVLDAAVSTAGGQLHDVRVSQVRYRPGDDLVVRYRCEVGWPGRGPTSETLLASCSSGPPPPDAIPVRAETDDGTLEVSVWRWPHDPVLPGLAAAVTPGLLQERLGSLDPVLAGGPVAVEVVAYRPTERAVVRAVTASGVRYVKVLAPGDMPTIVARHRLLGRAGLPVPGIVATDNEAGLLVLEELPGSTLRERLKTGRRPWPSPDEVGALLGSLADVPATGLPAAPDRLRDALGHADLLRAVAPDLAPVLDLITGAVTRSSDGEPAGAVVHGDLHEAQLVVDDRGRITGLLDIDDVGAGHPSTDAATLLAHLRFRASVSAPTVATDVDRYADGLEAAFIGAHPSGPLRMRTAATLVGLATGPFRIQRPDWRREASAVLDRAAVLVGGPLDEELLNSGSRSAHT